jgi:hypothetical protein
MYGGWHSGCAESLKGKTVSVDGARDDQRGGNVIHMAGVFRDDGEFVATGALAG